MLNFIRKIPSFSSVAAGSTANTLLVRGPTYQNITLHYQKAGVDATEAQCKTDITGIRLKINGVVRWEATATQLIDVLNKFYGIAFVNGQLTIPLSRPWMKTMEAEDNLGWGTGNVDTFGLEVDIAAAAGPVTLTGDAFVLPYTRDLGQIMEVHTSIFSTAVSGVFEIPNLPRGNGDLAAMHFANANITKAELYINQVAAIDGDLVTLQNLQKWIGLRTPQAGYVTIDALVRNRISDALPLRNMEDFRAKITLSAAGSVPIIMETLNTPLPASK